MILQENVAQQESEFVFRRLTETFKVIGLGKEVSGYYWLLILGFVLVVGVAFVAWMYRKDARSVRWYWATPLALLRVTVYLVLALMFLMPARQGYERLEKRSRVIVVLDVSDSLAMVSDDISRGRGTTKPITRLDRVMTFLSDEKVGFFKGLLEKNPTYVYRFGNRLDEEPQLFDKNDTGATVPVHRVPGATGDLRQLAGKPFDKSDWTAFASYDFKPWVLRGLSEEGVAKVKGNPAWEGTITGNADWAQKWFDKKDDAIPTDLTPDDKAALAYNREKLLPRVEVARSISQATNVPDSLLTVVNRESGNMVQGIVVFSDGRSNLGSDSVVQELKVRARREQIPVFTVTVGSEQRVVAVRITDVQAPSETPPDEPFRVIVEQDGEGLVGQKAKVELEIQLPGIEATIKLPAELTYAPGEPPHGQAEYIIDPDKVPDALKNKENPKELISGDWKIRAVTPTIEGERFAEKEHVSEWVTIKVRKKPARILVFCGAPNRDVQFFITQMIRDKADMSVVVQNDGGSKGLINLLEDKDRQLTRFPDTFNVDENASDKPEEKWYNLGRYDVIVAFDPDWNALTGEQISRLRTWVDLHAGGLILVAGHIHTKHLARPELDGKFDPLVSILPVLPGDPDLAAAKRDATTPWRLDFENIGGDIDFMKIDDTVPFEVGWERFFTGRDERDEKARVLRGFYNYFPVREMKPVATPLARYPDPNTIKMPDGKNPPWLCVMNYGQGKTMWIGSSEMWRLRQYRDEYFERFWTKATRWASSGSRRKQSTRGRLLLSAQIPVGGYIRATAQVLDPSLQPVPPNTDPKLTFRPLELDKYPPEFDKLTGDELARAKQKLHEKLTAEVRMSAKKEVGEWKGFFTRAQLASAEKFPPGAWRAELEIPSSTDTLKSKFTIRQSNPEVDETRPNPNEMYTMASSYDDVKPRLTDATIASKVQSACASGAEGKRLSFKFADEESLKLIPSCMGTETKTLRNRGAVEDYWDKGFTLPSFMTKWMTDKPMQVGYGLLLCVLLLSIEWMIRKLLKLA